MALGHWLKDYIGPNSANSGGGTVEVSAIKLANVHGGGAQAGNLYGFNGNGMTANQQPIGDIVGDKTVIGFACVGLDSNNRSYPANCEVWVGGANDNPLENPYLKTQENLKACHGFGVMGITEGSCSSVDVYAICI